jgi:Holliday junction DNA helicase RuvA
VIARLTGQVFELRADALVLDVQGVGYLVRVSGLTAKSLPAVGEPVSLAIHTHVREDALVLYGFFDEVELEAFEALIAMSGMGPKAAMGVLSGIEARELAQALIEDDLARLCMVPGIGKKKAERMALELKDRLRHLAQAGPAQALAGLEDLRSALSNLGFKPAETERALTQLRKIAGPTDQLEDLLPRALRILRG